jgi:hypothetical protein
MLSTQLPFAHSAAAWHDMPLVLVGVHTPAALQ